VREHLEGCEACRRFFESDLALVRRIREAGLSARAPAPLRRRIAAALAGERERVSGPAAAPPARPAPEPEAGIAGNGLRPGRAAGTRVGSGEPVGRGSARGELAGAPPIAGSAGLRWVAAAAVLALAAAATLAEWTRSPAVISPSVLFARDYAHHVMVSPVASHAGRVEHASGEEYVDSGSLTDITRFLGERAGLELEPVRIPAGRLAGGMICWLEGSPASVVMYERDGHAVYHYRMRTPSASGRAGSGELRVERRGPVRLVRWDRDGVAHALVSDLPAEALRSMAAEAAASGERPPAAGPRTS